MSLARHGLGYLLVSATCMALHNLVVISTCRFGLGLPAAVAASFLVVAPWGYTLHSRFTFMARWSAAGLTRYMLAMLPNLPVAGGSLWLFCGLLRWPPLLGSPAATAATVLLNYLASRWAVARPSGLAARERHA